MKNITVVFHLVGGALGSYQKQVVFTSPIKAYYYVRGMDKRLVSNDVDRKTAEAYLKQTAETTQKEVGAEFRVFID